MCCVCGNHSDCYLICHLKETDRFVLGREDFALLMRK